MIKSGKTLINTPNELNVVTVGCDCPICTLSPFEKAIGEYSKDDMNAVFQMLVGEATSPNRAKEKQLVATQTDHEKEAFAMSSAIFNRATYDKALMEIRHRPAPVKWGFESNGTPLGVARSGKVRAYTEGTHKTYFNKAKELGDLSKGKPYCEWLVVLKEQAERAAKNPESRDSYTEWRMHNPKTSKGRTTILYTDLWAKELGYPELLKNP
jgi:hypothetical protein